MSDIEVNTNPIKKPADKQSASPELRELTSRLVEFRDARNWKQYHTLKNLVVSLNLEAAELLELTQWLTDEQFESASTEMEVSQQIKDECADIFNYLLLIAEHHGFDLAAAAQAKIAGNEARYPVEKAYGKSTKYTRL